MMRALRLYLPGQNFHSGQDILLSPDHAHYAVHVRRLGVGDPIILFNAEMGGWVGTLIRADKKAIVTLQTQVQPPQEMADLWLLAAPIHKDNWPFLVEKATELGISALQPVLTEHTQARKATPEKTQTYLIEASQQCERTAPPELKPEQKLATVLLLWDKSRTLFAAIERADAKPLAQAAKEHPGPTAILIGPEGGFSAAEIELLGQYDFVVPVSLGPLILRAETAAIAALAVWQSVQEL